MSTSFLPIATPDAVGVCSQRLARMKEVLNREVEVGRLPGAVYTVARRGRVVAHESVGRLDPATDTAMPLDAVFRIYSMTKPVVSVAVMQLVEQGALLLGQPVTQWIPELSALRVSQRKGDDFELVPLERPVTVYDLLRHTAGLTYHFLGNSAIHQRYAQAGLFSRGISNQDFIRGLSDIPLLRQPGTAWGYSVATDVLGRLIEAVVQRPLGEHLKSSLFDPLQMADTAFHVPQEQQHRLAEPFATDPDTGEAVEVFNVRRPAKHDMGGAGLVSTAADYARFMQMMLNEGHLDGQRILGPKTVRLMRSDHLGDMPRAGDLLPNGYGFGLGFGVRLQDGLAPGAGSAGMYYWAGLAGTSFFIDPAESLHAQLLIQQPGRRDYYRQLFRELVYASLTD